MSLLTTEQPPPSSPSSVMGSSGVSESKYCPGPCRPGVVPAARYTELPTQRATFFRRQVYFIGRRVAGSFMWDFYSGISVRISWNFQSDVKSTLVPILNYPPTLELLSEERLQSRYISIVCTHFLSYQHSFFTVCVFVFLALVAEQLQGRPCSLCV